ncbi:DegV family protein [Spiroplasma endosymbiont of Othius punctulatus]|uniref:DegV family protein n=1 Tax=Spiroplasma endosymbiont of Othius punctulatus TaxID=3066289 RepID=UPI0030D4C7DB
MKKKIAIVLDSACGIQTFRDFNKNEDIHFVPLIISTPDGKNYNDDETLTVSEFETLLAKNPKLFTAQSTPGVVINLWTKLLEEYDEVVCLPISSGLSGQYQTMKMLSKDFNGKVHVVSTNGISFALHYVAKWAQQLIDEGLSGKEIAERLDKECESIRGYIVVQDLKRLVAGGRITPAVALLAKLLKICPILKWNGKIDKFDKARTWKKAVISTIEQLKSEGVKKVDFGSSLTNKDAEKFIMSELKDAGIEVGMSVYIAFVLSAHIGLDTFAFMPDLKETI